MHHHGDTAAQGHLAYTSVFVCASECVFNSAETPRRHKRSNPQFDDGVLNVWRSGSVIIWVYHHGRTVVISRATSLFLCSLMQCASCQHSFLGTHQSDRANYYAHHCIDCFIKGSLFKVMVTHCFKKSACIEMYPNTSV